MKKTWGPPSSIIIIFTCLNLLMLIRCFGNEDEKGCPEFPYFGPHGSSVMSFARINCDFHKRYEERVAQVILSFGAANDSIFVKKRPIILVLGDSMIFKANGEKETVDVLPREYHIIKSFGHASFAVLLSLHEASEGIISGTTKTQLLDQRRHLQDAVTSISTDLWSPELKNIASTMGVETLALLDQVITDSYWSKTQLQNYYLTVRPSIDQIFMFAAKSQLDSLDSYVNRWMSQLSTEEKNDLGVVVASAHQARAGDITMQYFERKLNKNDGVGALREDGLVALEGKFDEEAALALLARHYVDRDEAFVIFDGDSARLQRDALSDAAEQYLALLLPEASPETDRKINSVHIGAGSKSCPVLN